jgi:uncharacterized protein (TIGR04255 family)
VLTIGDEATGAIARFQDRIRAAYPLFEQEVEQHMRVEITEAGVLETKREAHPVFRFLNLDRHWRVSVTPQSLALEAEAKGYAGWPDFANRIATLITAVRELFNPSHVLSIGVRFLNAAPAEGPEDPRLYCTPELTSVTGQEGLKRADLLWDFKVDEGDLLLRSGLVLPNTTYDPHFFEPRPVLAWYLDIDVIRNEVAQFDDQRVSAAILAQVLRLYEIYRWALPKQRGVPSAL